MSLWKLGRLFETFLNSCWRASRRHRDIVKDCSPRTCSFLPGLRSSQTFPPLPCRDCQTPRVLSWLCYSKRFSPSSNYFYFSFPDSFKNFHLRPTGWHFPIEEFCEVWRDSTGVKIMQVGHLPCMPCWPWFNPQHHVRSESTSSDPWAQNQEQALSTVSCGLKNQPKKNGSTTLTWLFPSIYSNNTAFRILGYFFDLIFSGLEVCPIVSMHSQNYDAQYWFSTICGCVLF